MFARRLTLFSTLALALTAGLAHAQTPATSAVSSGASGQNLIDKAFASAITAAEPAQAGAAGAPGDRYYNPRVFIGAWTASGNGLVLGGGLAAHPFDDRRHELQGNLAYLRVEESNGLDIDLNYAYNFVEQTAGEWTPYAGGGINIVHFGGSDECSDFEDAFDIDLDCGATDTGLQIGGGVKRVWNGWQLFGELWFAFNADNPIIIRGGVGW